MEILGNTKKLFTLTVLCSFICAILAGCSSDNDGIESDSDFINILRSNKWCSDAEFSYGTGSEGHIWTDMETTTLYFTSNKDGVMYWVQKDNDSELGSNISTDYSYFTYTVSGRSVIIKYVDGYTYTYSFSDDALIRNNDKFNKRSIDSGDLSLLKSISPQMGSCGSYLNYVYYPKTHSLVISGKGNMADYTSTNQPWHDFYIEWVIVEEGCTSIGNNAFTNMWQITDVDLPSTLTRIGDNAFAQTSITKIVIPDNVSHVGNSAFADCQYLKSVTLGDNLTEIGDFAFYTCSVKRTLTLPKEVVSVGKGAFGSWKITSLTLNDGLKSIGTNAFYVTGSTVTIPNSVETIESLAITGTFSKLIIGTGLRHLAKNAFDGSSSGGKMYVNLGIPLEIYDDGAIFAENQDKWNLYVPKGSYKAYKWNKSWSGFKSISEDESLVSGNGSAGTTPDEIELTPKYDPKNLTYVIDGVSYKMVLVTGNGFKPFYIMQTELPPNGNLKIGTDVIGTLDTNYDDCVISYEFSQFLNKLIAATGIPFRLPTTAEWQYASKGGQYSKGYAYSGSDNIEDVAWYSGNSGKAIHPIAQKKPNELGLYDMTGNYAEVCNDDDEKVYNIDGNLCGGNWDSSLTNCKLGSNIKAQQSSGKIPGKVIRNKNAFDGRYETVRLVYTAP